MKTPSDPHPFFTKGGVNHKHTKASLGAKDTAGP